MYFENDPKSLEHLEGLGLEAVLAKLADGSLATAGGEFETKAKLWARDKVASVERAAREAETLSIARSALSAAKDANVIARSASRWAMWAAIAAIIAIAIATKDQILALIFPP